MTTKRCTVCHIHETDTFPFGDSDHCPKHHWMALPEPCSYTGCRGHFLVAGSARIGAPKVWCAEHANLADFID